MDSTFHLKFGTYRVFGKSKSSPWKYEGRVHSHNSYRRLHNHVWHDWNPNTLHSDMSQWMNRRAVFNGKDSSLGWMPWSRIAFPKRCAFSEFLDFVLCFFGSKLGLWRMVHHGFLIGCLIFWHFWPWDSSPLVECLELYSKTFQARLKKTDTSMMEKYGTSLGSENTCN